MNSCPEGSQVYLHKISVLEILNLIRKRKRKRIPYPKHEKSRGISPFDFSPFYAPSKGIDRNISTSVVSFQRVMLRIQEAVMITSVISVLFADVKV